MVGLSCVKAMAGMKAIKGNSYVISQATRLTLAGHLDVVPIQCVKEAATAPPCLGGVHDRPPLTARRSEISKTRVVA